MKYWRPRRLLHLTQHRARGSARAIVYPSQQVDYSQLWPCYLQAALNFADLAVTDKCIVTLIKINSSHGVDEGPGFIHEAADGSIPCCLSPSSWAALATGGTAALVLPMAAACGDR